MADYPAFGVDPWHGALKAYIDGLLGQEGQPLEDFKAALAAEIGDPTSEAGVLLSAASAAAAKAEIKPLRAGSAASGASGPIITFIDDDANPLFHDIWEVITDEKQIPISIAAIWGGVLGDPTVSAAYPSMSVNELKALRAKGHDILNHSWTHYPSYDAAYSAAFLEEDWSKGRDAMIANGFTECADILVYPGGLGLTDYAKKESARRVAQYGIVASGSFQATPVDNYGVQRINLDTATEAVAKGAIDGAKANNMWLIFMTHCKELDTTGGGRAAQMTKIRNVIDYAVAQSVPIMKWSDAEKRKGNAISIGEKTLPGHTAVSRSGKQSWSGGSGKWTPTLFGTTVAGAHVYASQKGFYQANGGMGTIKGFIQIAAGAAAVLIGATDAVNITSTGALTLTVNGTTFSGTTLTAGDTPATVVSKINTQYGTALVASLVGNKLRLATGTTGPAVTLSVAAGTGSVLADLGLTVGQSAVGSGGLDGLMSGNLRVGGLPAAVKMSTLDIAAYLPVRTSQINLGASYTGVWAKVSSGTPDFLTLLRGGNNVGEGFLTPANLVAGTTLELAFTATYLINDPPGVWA